MAPDLPILVYGDDLIVEDDSRYVKLPEIFEKYKLKINVDKSFTSGSFRESCGCDAFQGEVITPVRIKKELTTADPVSIAALVDSSNMLYKTGYWHLAKCLREINEANAGTAIPTSHVREDVAGLSHVYSTDGISNTNVVVTDKCEINYRRKTLVLKVPQIPSRIDDKFGLLIGLTRPSEDQPPSCVMMRNKSCRARLSGRFRDLHSIWTNKNICA
jgi:hypothetical protein